MPSASTVDTLEASIDALLPAVRSGILITHSDESQTLPSFSAVKWADFFVKHQTEFGFRSRRFEYSNYWMDNDIAPTYKLPQSFQKELCKIAMVWMTAYSFKRKDRTKEEANLRLPEPVSILTTYIEIILEQFSSKFTLSLSFKAESWTNLRSV
jgi:hypothetical protein